VALRIDVLDIFGNILTGNTKRGVQLNREHDIVSDDKKNLYGFGNFTLFDRYMSQFQEQLTRCLVS
jgi:hypothetical protein